MAMTKEERAERLARVVEIARKFEAEAEHWLINDLTAQRSAWDAAEMCSVHTLLDEWEDATKIPVTPEIRAAAISALDARIAALREGGGA